MLASCLRAFGLIAFTWSWLANDHYRPWVNFHAEALAFAAITLLAAARMLTPGPAPIAPKLIAVVGLIALIPWLQWLGGVNGFAGDALLSSMYLICFAVAIAVGCASAGNSGSVDDKVPPFIHVLWIAAIVSAGIGLAQWLDVQGGLQMYAAQTDLGDRAMGNLGQPNQLATLLLMGIASLTLVFEKRRIGPRGYGLAVAFLSLVLLLTESRTGFIGILVVAGFVLWKMRGWDGRLSPAAVLLWAAACVVVRPVVPYIQSLLFLGSGRGMSLTQGDSRLLIWKQVGWGTLQSPWLGYGWNHTPTAHAAGALAFPGSLTYTNAHNVVLDLVAWNGVPLGLLVAGLCAYWILTRMQRVRQASTVYAMAALLPLIVHSLLEYPFAYAYFLVAAGLLVGFVEADVGGETRSARAPVRWWTWGALSLWVVAGTLIVSEYLDVEEDFRVVRFENLRVGKTPAEYRAPRIRVLSHMGAMLDSSRIRPAPGMDRVQLERLGQVARRFPYGALALRNALALGLNGDANGATRQMAVIRGMYGEHYYAAAKYELRLMQAEKYPQLSAVRAP